MLNEKTKLPLKWVVSILGIAFTLGGSIAIAKADAAKKDEKIAVLESRTAAVEQRAYSTEKEVEVLKALAKETDKKLDRILDKLP
jgi:hypothetical protein